MGSKPEGVPGADFLQRLVWGHSPEPVCTRAVTTTPNVSGSLPVSFQLASSLLSPQWPYKIGIYYPHFTDTEHAACMPNVMQWLTGPAGIKKRRELLEIRKVNTWRTRLWRKEKVMGHNLLSRTHITRNAKITKNSLLNLILQCNHLFIIYLTAIY